MKERTNQDLQNHLKKIPDCSNFYRKFIKSTGPEGLKPGQDYLYKFLPILCKSPFCPNCARVRQKNIIRRLKASTEKNNFRFFTLTTVNSYNTRRDLLHIEKCWRQLLKILYKSYPKLTFFRVIELGTENGMVHIHGLWNIYIDFIELSKLWCKLSGAYRVNLKSVFNDAGAIAYITKYISKTFDNYNENEIFYLMKKRKFSFSKNFQQISKSTAEWKIYSYLTFHKNHLRKEINSMIKDLLIPESNIILDNLFNEDIVPLPNPPPDLFATSSYYSAY